MTGQFLKPAERLAALLVLALATPSVFSDVTLVSQEARSGSGGWSTSPFEPGTNNPTTWTTSTNFTTVDPSGLHLKITRGGSVDVFRSAPVGTTLNAAWTIQDFSVVFRVDEPTPYSVEAQGLWRAPATELFYPVPFLRAEDGTTVFPNPPAFTRDPQRASGILQPGTYTFAGRVGYEVSRENPPPVQPFLPLTESGSFTAELTVGVPEPGALGFVGGLVLCAGRRQRRDR